MNERLKITINNKEFEASPGATILDVVREYGIDTIPTLCHDPKLPAYGSCYLCVVEVEGMEKLVPSCSSPVVPGMVIRTNNERIRESRKTALELLLSNHYADCLGPCTQTCPAGVDVQGYIALMSMGKHREAIKLIKEKNPLPLVCGRVCVRECETACRRNLVDDRVGIDYLKRYASDIDMGFQGGLRGNPIEGEAPEKSKNHRGNNPGGDRAVDARYPLSWASTARSEPREQARMEGATQASIVADPWTPEVPEPNGRKVAVIGGGPAGLTCAYFLILKGYDVTIFESSPKLGGMLRYGIPEYRLPKAMLDREIGWITDLGVRVTTDATLGKDFTINSLKEAGFDAIFVAIGAQKAKTMGLDGEATIEGILGGADFLRQMQTENPPKLHGSVVVVGGGNTAVDAARTALRIGAKKVFILYRRTMKEMPAHQMEIDAAVEEGVEIIFLSAPLSIVATDGRIEALRCIRMELGEPDASGRRSPAAVAGSEYDLACDFVISAIGQDIDSATVDGESGLSTTRQKTIMTDKISFATSLPGVFAGGDAITGPAVAIDAIAHGRAAAASIDHYLKIGSAFSSKSPFLSRKEAFGAIPESEFRGVLRVEKEKMAEFPVAERVLSLAEVELGFTEKQAFNEAGRCLECGCSAYFDCDLRKHANDFGVDIGKFVGDTRRHRIDATHPLITLDPNKCINCGRCVRTCSEILEVSALGFVHRGFKSVVKPSMEKPLLETTCVSCGNCIGACPTGAITEKLPFRKPGPWAFKEVESLCSFCSIGCNLAYRSFHDDLFTVSTVNGQSHNKGYLCNKGRFGYRYMMEKDRVLKPMIRRRGEWHEVAWDEAFIYSAQRIDAVAAGSGADSIAVLASPKMTNEDLYLLQRFVRSGLKNNNIASFGNLVNGVEQDALDSMIGATVSTATMDDLAKADVILAVNTDFSEGNLIAELKIKAAQKGGSRLVTVTSSEIPLVRFSELWIDSKRGTNAALINGICKAIIDKGFEDKTFIEGRTEGYERLKESTASLDVGLVSEITGVKREKLLELFDLVANPAANVVVVYSIDSLWEKSRGDLKALGNLMMLTGRMGKPANGIILLRDFANSQGLFDMGADPRYLPGYVRWDQTARIEEMGNLWGTDLRRVFRPANLKDALERGRVKGLLVFGEDPLSVSSSLKLTSAVDFMLVVDSFMTETAAEADVFLPAPLPIEMEGTYTSCDRRVQELSRLQRPKTGMENRDIINGLAEKMGIPLGLTTIADIREEMKKAVPPYGSISRAGFWGDGLLAKAFMTTSGRAQFSIPGIDVTPHSGEKKHYLFGENYFDLRIRSRLTK